MSHKKAPMGSSRKSSAVTTRKMTPEEREYADKAALNGLRGLYSKYDCNEYYGKEDMQALKAKIEELEDATMKPLAKEILEQLREQYPAGTRVELVSMNDPYTQIPVGTCGTVGVVDDIGTIHVRWDNGSGLGVVYGEDSVRIVSDSETELKSDGDKD